MIELEYTLLFVVFILILSAVQVLIETTVQGGSI